MSQRGFNLVLGQSPLPKPLINRTLRNFITLGPDFGLTGQSRTAGPKNDFSMFFPKKMRIEALRLCQRRAPSNEPKVLYWLDPTAHKSPPQPTGDNRGYPKSPCTPSKPPIVGSLTKLRQARSLCLILVGASAAGRRVIVSGGLLLLFRVQSLTF